MTRLFLHDGPSIAKSCTSSYKLKPDARILESKTSSVDKTDNMQVMNEEVEEAERKLKAEKSPGTYNIPAELPKRSSPEMIEVLITLCQGIRKKIHNHSKTMQKIQNYQPH